MSEVFRIVVPAARERAMVFVSRSAFVAAFALTVGAVAIAPCATSADDIRAAVAAHFIAPVEDIAASFSAETGHTVRFSIGSTGKLFTQIVNGAPFEVLLAADEAHPQRLEAEGFAVAGSRRTYATGRLVLWSSAPGVVDDRGAVLTRSTGKVAIVNPDLAPYGAAAVAAMRALGAWEAARPRLVRGENLTQVYQFVATGNAELGFIALSQVVAKPVGSHWLVPETLHPPLRHDAVLLRAGADSAAARAFLDYLAGETARGTIRRYGYELD
jgi:molybdate transport system substrate-binding protein